VIHFAGGCRLLGAVMAVYKCFICKWQSPVTGYHCGSRAFNLASEGIDQGNLCDRHYWQSQVVAERRLHDLLKRATKPMEWYLEYLDTAPVWHCTGYEASVVQPLLKEMKAALEPNKEPTP
jgi:hypothetical protein